MFKLSELKKMPDLPTDHLEGYVNIPKGYTIKKATDFGHHVLLNTEGTVIIEYSYYETSGYGVSASDHVSNGHYEISNSYTARDDYYNSDEKPKDSK